MIVLQAGHENTKNHCNLNLRSSTGAPGEAEFTVRIKHRLAEILRSKGFQTKEVDATYSCDPTSDDIDYNLFLAIHYDADIYGTGGGFLDVPEPSTDGAAAESARIKDALESEYFNNTGIVNKPQRRNANTRYYYMWQALSLKTPCVIIECGVGKDAHDSVILADTDRVCNAIARGICKAFNIPFDPPTPPPPTPTPPPPPEPTPEPPTPPTEPQYPDLRPLLAQVKDIVFGKGWTWTKIGKLKALLG